MLGSAGGPRRAFSLARDERLLARERRHAGRRRRSARWPRRTRRSDALVTMAVIPNPDPARYGGVVIDDGGAVTGFSRRGATGPSWHFVGVQIAERAAFERFPTACRRRASARSTRRSSPSGLAACGLSGARSTFRDIGTPADYLAACLALADGPAALRAADAQRRRGCQRGAVRPVGGCAGRIRRPALGVRRDERCADSGGIPGAPRRDRRGPGADTTGVIAE